MRITFPGLALNSVLPELKDRPDNRLLLKQFVKKCLFVIVVFVSVVFQNANAQSDPQYSQNMYNRLPVNPAYAGSSGANCATMLLRNQWVGFDGAPKTANLAFDALVEPVHGGVGFTFLTDKIGLTSTNAFKLAYAYRLRLMNNGRLAFGLDGGFIQTSFDKINAIPGVPNDPGIPNDATAFAPDFGFGAYFNTSDYYIGASVTHLNAPKLSFNNADITLERHFYLMGGFNYDLNRTLTFKPSLFVKSDKTSTQVDINTTLLYNNAIWAGVSYRLDDSVILMAGMNITNELKFGYSYDVTTSVLNTQSKGSHELMLRYCFKIKNNKPAYMNRTTRFL